MPKIHDALVVGGGIGGMAAAITLARNGIETRLIDIDPQWRVYGAGITITGPTLRAMHALGILDEVMAEGHTADGIKICDRGGAVLTELATPRLEGGRVPGAGGILRPTLHAIMARQVRAAGVDVRLGRGVTALHQQADGVEAVFDDGTQAPYDIVVGADGIFSSVRALLLPHAAPPLYMGQVCWRLMLRRPPEIDKRHFFLGGHMKVGLTPVSADGMYMFLLERAPEKRPVSEIGLADRLAVLLAEYGGILADIRDGLNDASRIIPRPLESVFLDGAWHRGNAILIGDAAHATTPQLASGAGMAIEDGIVLGEEVAGAGNTEEAFRRFGERRYARCRMVVENSREIGRLETSGAPAAAQTAVVERSLKILGKAF